MNIMKAMGNHPRDTLHSNRRPSESSMVLKEENIYLYQWHAVP